MEGMPTRDTLSREGVIPAGHALAWRFDSVEEAYTFSQTNEKCHDGDVLIVTNQGVGVLTEAWPTLVASSTLTADEIRREFYTFVEGVTWENFEGGRYVNCVALALEVGF